MSVYYDIIMKDETRKFVEESYKSMQETFIKLNNKVKKGDITAEEFVKKRSQIIKEYQDKRNSMELN